MTGNAQAPDPTLLGAGVRSRPAYDGSKEQTGDLIPVVRYYGKPLFARTTQGMLEGGARTALSKEWTAGAQLAYEGGREKSESPLLRARNTPDLDPGASIGVHAEWDGKLGPAPVTFLARLRQHLDTDRGAQADFRLTAGVFQQGGALAGVFAQATLASGKSIRAFYEVSESGLLFVSAGVLGSYDLSRQWMLVGSLEARRLASDVARSPLVERRSNGYASVGIAYRFSE